MHVQKFESMIGKTMVSVTGSAGDDVMTFTSTDGQVFQFLHYQDCCEDVKIDDVVGDLTDLIGSPLIMAEEVSSIDDQDLPKLEDWRAGTWTFYRFATKDGLVSVRWLGISNGYYSEEVSFKESSLND